MNKNDSNEVGMLVNLQDWTNIMINGTENGVTLKKDKAASNLICTAPKNSLLFFHNHPKNSCFSEKDLESFMISDAIKMMSVVCNNGRLYYLIKMDTFDKCEALMHYETIYSKIESGSVKEFLRCVFSLNEPQLWAQSTLAEVNEDNKSAHIVVHDEFDEVKTFNSLALKQYLTTGRDDVKYDAYAHKNAYKELVELGYKCIEDAYPKPMTE